MWKVDSLEKTLMLGGIRGRRRRGWQRKAGWHHWLYGRESEWTPGVGDGQGGLVCCDSRGHKESGHNWAAELNWTLFMGYYSTVETFHGDKQDDWLTVCVLSHVWLWDPMDYPPHLPPLRPRIIQTRTLEWVCYFLLQGIFPAQGLNPCRSCISKWVLYHWAT